MLYFTTPKNISQKHPLKYMLISIKGLNLQRRCNNIKAIAVFHHAYHNHGCNSQYLLFSIKCLTELDLKDTTSEEMSETRSV